jgi:cytochrome P450
MTDGEVDVGGTTGAQTDASELAGFSRSAPGQWTASQYRDVQSILADDRFEVATAPDGGAVGTIAWLRAAVSRFTNGADHQQRRARIVEELRTLDPEALRTATRQRADTALSVAGRPGDRIEVMAHLARPVPMASMADILGIADPGAAAEAVIAVAAAYFPGSGIETQVAADRATAQLVGMLEPAELDAIVARIALMVQGCDATAALIGITLHVLGSAPQAATDPRWSTERVLAEVLRHTPPLRASRRVAREPVTISNQQLAAGDTVVCDIDVANRDPAAFERPLLFDPARRELPSLTFGYGLRPCPGQAQALTLAAGVVDAVRQKCRFLPDAPFGYEPSNFLRVPQRVEVVLA